MNRLKNLNVAIHTHFDVCIIGSSAVGLNCALEASLQGLKVVVLEPHDFGQDLGLSNSKMVDNSPAHWLNALKKGQFSAAKAVLEAQNEKKILKQQAPMFVHRCQTLTPYKNWWSFETHKWALARLDQAKAAPEQDQYKVLTPTQAQKRYAALNAQGVYKASLHSDVYVDDARYILALAQTANDKGAVLINHIQLKKAILDDMGQLKGVECADALKDKGAVFTVKAQAFVCASPSLFDILRPLTGLTTALPLTWTKEAYIVLPATDWPRDMALRWAEDGVFALPWQGQMLVGPLRRPIQTPQDRFVSAQEAQELLEILGKWLPFKFNLAQIKSSQAHLVAAYQKHDFIQEKNGLITAFSASWLNFRAISHRILAQLLPILRGGHGEHPIQSADLVLCPPIGEYVRQQHILQQKYFLSNSVMRRLNQKYGVHTLKVLSLILRDTSLKAPLITGLPILRAEVMYAIIHEMACTVDDVLTRRIGLTHTNWRAAAQATGITASLMYEVLGWPIETAETRAEAYLDALLEEKEPLYPDPFD